LAVVTLTGVVEIWMVLCAATCLGFAQVFDHPTRQAFLAELVPGPELPNAIALQSASFQVARIVGPAIAGILIVVVGTGTCFALNALSFVAVIVALRAMRASELFQPVPVKREKGQIREGLRYIWHTPVLRYVLAMTTIAGTLVVNYNVVLA